jgi:cbb3-type cytochrome oxidase subunit 1
MIKTYNKFAKLAHFVRWTAAHLHKCGFAAQNFTTLVQIRISRLQRRYTK